LAVRLMLLCAALCVANAPHVVSAKDRSETVSLVDAAPASIVSTPAAEPAEPPALETRQPDAASTNVPLPGPGPVPPQSLTRSELCRTAVAVAAANNLPVIFFINLIHQESGFKPHVVSPAGAEGIAQFMPRVAASYGLADSFEPIAALTASGKLLAELVTQFGNLGLAAAAYNAGPRRVQDWMAKRGRLPEETRNYVRNITGQPAERWARVKARTQETRLPAHARCPGMPLIEVSVPEAAPVKLARGKSKAASKVAAAPKESSADSPTLAVAATEASKIDAATKELPKLAAARTPGSKMPKSSAAKPFALASAPAGKQVAVIRNGKIQIAAAKIAAAPKQPASKPAAVKVVVAAKETKAAAKVAAKPAAKAAPVKLAAAAPAKPAAKPATKTAAKSQSKPPAAKGVKVAAAR
jgi:hypothetical protein